ncbi:MAG: T9SS type A sorting domain-containing protein [Bacteroidales bacterium]|nr:T9SS type A sorting domain-containing protein [Bacteroidales bacterium]
MKTSKIINPYLLLIIPLLLISFTTGDSKSEYILPRAAYSVTTGDIDLDGDNDIVVGHNYNSQTLWSGVSILLNTGEGHFSLIDSLYLFGWQSDVQLTNLNTNVIPEIIAKKEDPVLEAEYISIIYDNDLNDIIDYNLNTYEGVGIIKYGDIDGDDYPDIVIASNSGQFWGVLYNDGSGYFSPPQYHDVQDYYPSDIACADLNEDGREDIVIVGQKTEVYFSYSNGFQLLTLETNSFKGSVSIDDFDKNGTNDIATVLSLYPYDYTLLKFYSNLGNNNIIVEDSIIFQPLCFGEFKVSDFNNDTFPDLLFHPADNQNLLVLYNNGNFNLSDPYLIPMADYGEANRRTSCADFDGNGFNDIATIRYLHAPIINLNILFNDGQGNFVENPITNIQTSNFEPQTSNLTCYPNPFKSETTFEIDIKETARVELSVYNLQGKPIINLVNNKLKGDIYNIKWDGTNKNNQEVNPGIYFVTLKTTGKTLQQTKIIKR